MEHEYREREGSVSTEAHVIRVNAGRPLTEDEYVQRKNAQKAKLAPRKHVLRSRAQATATTTKRR